MLTNLGEIPLNYFTELHKSHEDDTEIDDKKSDVSETSSVSLVSSMTNSGLIYVEPPSGVVEAFSSFTLKVIYYPSVSVELNSCFNLQVKVFILIEKYHD